MICTQSVMYSLVSTEQTKSTVTVSTLVFIDILYAQYLVGFTQLFDLQEKHGTRKHTYCFTSFLIPDLCSTLPIPTIGPACKCDFDQAVSKNLYQTTCLKMYKTCINLSQKVAFSCVRREY